MVISMFGYVSGVMLAVPRMLFALGRDGYLPAPLARVHGKYNTPHIAIMVQVVLVIALATSGSFEQLAVLANVAALAVYAACCVAVLVLRRREAGQSATKSGGPGDGAFRAPLGGTVPVLALAAIGWLFSSLTKSEWLSLAVIAAIAAAIYVVSSRGRRALSAPTEAAT
jgi:basic amino acid/polyamine antiporter, APA family